MENFAAIDFETANENFASVCAVGVIVVRDGMVANQFYSLIRPVPNYYRWFCSEVEPLIAGLPLVAHNARFDERCLREAHRAYGMVYPEYTFYDTLRASRQTFGSSLPDHQLPTSARACGYDLTAHHHALADAEAAAAIALKIL